MILSPAEAGFASLKAADPGLAPGAILLVPLRGAKPSCETDTILARFVPPRGFFFLSPEFSWDGGHEHGAGQIPEDQNCRGGERDDQSAGAGNSQQSQGLDISRRLGPLR